jgi:prepilin-type N-terminal cleavage/methylation domain-containing protein
MIGLSAKQPKRFHGGSFRAMRGFTLLELMAVVAVMVVIGAMAIPAYQNYTRNYRIRNDSNNLVGLMTVARMRAGSDFARTAVSCDSTAKPPICKLYSMQYNSGATPCTLSTWTQETEHPYSFSATVTFGIPTGVTYGVQGQSATAPAQVYAGQTNPYTIYFNSRGWPIDCSGNLISNYALYLQDQPGSFSMAVGVDSSGRSQVYLLNGNTFWTLKD